MTTIDINNLPEVAEKLALSNRFVPAKYDLRLNITPTKPNFTGTLEINLEENSRFSGSSITDSDAKFELVLNSAELITTSSFLMSDTISQKLKTKLDKKTQTVKLYSDEITVDELLSSESKLSLKIDYIGVVRQTLTYDDFTKGVFKTHYTNPETGKSNCQLVSSHTLPAFAKYIFPCIDDVLVKAPIKLSLTTDIKYTCVSVAAIEKTEILDDTKKLVIFEETPKMATSAFAFTFGNLDYLEETVVLKSNKEFPIRIYTQQGESKRGYHALSIAKKALPIIESKFCVDYPLPKLDLVALPFLSDVAVENWSLIQILNDYILTPAWDVTAKSLEEKKKSIETVIIHELAHMYVGDYVTYESFDYTWLNESFATFMANAVLSEMKEDIWLQNSMKDMIQMKRVQGNNNIPAIFVSNVKTDRINDTYAPPAYEKGIFLLRMLANLFNDTPSDNFDNFFRIVGDFVSANKFGTFRPIDLWKFLKSHELNKFYYDIPTIMNAWIRLPGFPLLTVLSSNDGKIEITQNRFLVSADDTLENVPYQVPLFIKLKDGKIGKQLLTDRKLEINSDGFLFANANNTVIANIQYSLSLYESIAENFDKLNPIEQCQVFSNLSSIFGTHYQTDDDIIGFFKIVEVISKNVRKVDANALNLAVTILNNISRAILTTSYNSDLAMHKKLSQFIDKFSTSLLNQFEWKDVDYSALPEAELNARSGLLSLDYKNETASSITKQLFKRFMHGPKKSVPKKLLGPVLTSVQANGGIKEYKDIFKLIKNPGLIINNVIEDNVTAEIQASAIGSLGCVSSLDLRHKTLNYVQTNLNVTMIELALVGFKYQPDTAELLWNWFALHFNAFYVKILRDKDGKSPFSKFFKTCFEIVSELCSGNDKLKLKLEAFLKAKNIEQLNDEYSRIQASYKSKLQLSNANDSFKEIF